MCFGKRNEELLVTIKDVLTDLLSLQRGIVDPDDGKVVPAYVCFVCAKHAVARGMSYAPGESLRLSDGTRLHEAVTANNGTPVCWYHVDHDIQSELRPSGTQ